MDSIDESYKDNNYYDGSIIKNALEDIHGGIQIHPELNAREARFKIRDLIKQPQNEWKVSELSEKSMVKCLHKLFKTVVNELNNALPNLG